MTGAVAEPEKIYMTIKTDGTYRPDCALSEEQKQILNVFGLDEQYVKKGRAADWRHLHRKEERVVADPEAPKEYSPGASE